jgi:RNA polymerase-binding transcription factor DksA
MTDDDTTRLLRDAVAQLQRIAATQEQIARELERGNAERHRELMRALADVLQALDKIERTQYG